MHIRHVTILTLCMSLFILSLFFSTLPVHRRSLDTGATIALCFLLSDSFPQELTWYSYISSNHAFKVFIHGVSADVLNTEFKTEAEIVRPIKTRWGTLSIVIAQNVLLRYALMYSSTLSRFVLLSGHCIPVKPVSYFYAKLCEKKSVFTLLDQKKRFPRYNSLLNHLSQDHIFHHHQWCILERAHAELLVRRERLYLPWFLHVWAPDEVAYLSILSYFNQKVDVVSGTGTTFAHWWDLPYKFSNKSLHRAHPKTYLSISLEELMFIHGLPCLIARKFSAECTVIMPNHSVSLLTAANNLLWHRFPVRSVPRPRARPLSGLSCSAPRPVPPLAQPGGPNIPLFAVQHAVI